MLVRFSLKTWKVFCLFVLVFVFLNQKQQEEKKRGSVFYSRILVEDELQAGESVVTAGKKKSKRTKSLGPAGRKDYSES